MSTLVNYQLIRSSKRKTVAIKVSADTIEVRAPYYVSKQSIDAFVIQKQQWIYSKQIQQQQKRKQQQIIAGIDGEKLYYLGKPLTLSVLRGERHNTCHVGNMLEVTINKRTAEEKLADSVFTQIEKWYQQQALEILTKRSLQFAQKINQQPSAIKVRRTKSKWGHCTSRKVLQYNWLVIQAPQDVIDYLVAHEVSHLRHMNHSKAFWNQVAVLCPQWQTHRKWLQDNGHSLELHKG